MLPLLFSRAVVVLLLAPSSLPYPLYLVEGSLLGAACEESVLNTQVYTSYNLRTRNKKFHKNDEDFRP